MKRTHGHLGTITDVSDLPMPDGHLLGIDFIYNNHFIQAYDRETHFFVIILDASGYEWTQKFMHSAINRGFRWRRVRKYIAENCFPKALLT